MIEEFPSIPNFEELLKKRIAQKTDSNTSLPPPGTVDPYKIMLQRKKEASGEVSMPDPSTIQKWPEEDVKELEDFCKRNGIVGVSTRINPKIALMQLKRQIGDYSGVALEDRVPEGYQKINAQSKYNVNYPYFQEKSKKQILHG